MRTGWSRSEIRAMPVAEFYELLKLVTKGTDD